MTYTEVPLDEFNGLQLADDPEQVGLNQAVNSLNHDPGIRDRFRQRPGTDAFIGPVASATAVAAIQSIPMGGGVDRLAVQFWPLGAAPGTKAYDNTGANTGTIADTGRSMVTYGGTAGTAIYMAMAGSVRKMNTAGTFSVPGTIPGADFLAVMPRENRLIVVRASTVYFSEAGAPEDFTGGFNNILDPGDGEDITAIVTWRELVFAFKTTKFYVFTGSYTDNTGEPVFNYRPVYNAVGGTAEIRAACAARDGVYFVARDGIYRTEGGTPVKVSGPLDAWFAGDTLPLATDLPVAQPITAVNADAHRLYAGCDDGTFILDFDSGQWAFWDLAVTAVGSATLTNGAPPTTLIGVEDSVFKLSPTYTDDDGTPIAWAYRTGASDLGATEPKTIRQAQAWGAGSVAVSVYVDHGTSDAGTSTLTLGTAPAVVRAVQSYARHGTFFSLGLRGTGPVNIHRAVLDVRETRLAGVG